MLLIGLTYINFTSQTNTRAEIDENIFERTMFSMVCVYNVRKMQKSIVHPVPDIKANAKIFVL